MPNTILQQIEDLKETFKDLRSQSERLKSLERYDECAEVTKKLTEIKDTMWECYYALDFYIGNGDFRY